MTLLKNDLLLRALLRQETERTPIWIMRQAGRYLPEYRATRQRAGDFLTLCKTPELACEVTLQPLARFELDAAILFSDILTVPDAMGLGLYFIENEGPRFAHPLREERAICALAVPDPEDDLGYVMAAMQMARRALDGRVPLIGFSGSPFTLACYMIEGGGSKDFRYVKTMLYSRPDLLHHILSVTTDAVTAYLNAQIRAGAQAVQIFDTWGGILTRSAYLTFSLPYMRRILDGLISVHENRRVPCILFTKGGGQWLESMADTAVEAIGLDWHTDIGDARRRVGERVALQGNLDPCVLFAQPAVIEAEVQHILTAVGVGSGHVFNLGHGISQYVDPANVAVLVDAVHRMSTLSRQK